MRHERDWKAIEEDVERLGVPAACQKHGIHRSTWYRHLGDPGKVGEPPQRGLEESVLAISAERPSWGCDRIAYYLGLSGVRVSSPTVQKILISRGLGRRSQRKTRAHQTTSEA